MVDNSELKGKLLTWKVLQAMEAGTKSPFILQDKEGEKFFSERIVRIVPKRRLVAFGYWHDKPVVAKIFFSRDAAKHRMSEVASIKRLQEAKVPTPAVIYDGETADGLVHFIILKRIFSSDNLYELWEQRANILLSALKRVMIELATQHVLGILQQDLHLKNFLLTEKVVYTLDAAQMDFYPPVLPKELCLANVALFLSQLGVGLREIQHELIGIYAKSRGWVIKPQDEKKIYAELEKCNRVRWKKFAKKIYRSSTDFISHHHRLTRWSVKRAAYLPQLQTFLQNPDRVFQHPTMVLLKAGRSSTVIKLCLDQQNYVIKRYNIKNFWHFLRRCFRTTRAEKNWRLANKLALFGVATPKPIAYLEKRFFGLRLKSYYVCEYIPGKDLRDYICHETDVNKIDQLMKMVMTLLDQLRQLKIAHGDLKATNILFDEQQKPILIDLDGAREFMTQTGLNTAWEKEMARLKANFTHLPSVLKKLEL